MDPAWKAKWVEWLRDPAHKQTKGVLHRPGVDDENVEGFCCLGGACEISGLSTWEVYINSGYERKYLGRRLDLPTAVSELLGLPDTDPYVPLAVAVKHLGREHKGVALLVGTDVAVVRLSNLNDSGATFEQIANIIEEAL